MGNSTNTNHTLQIKQWTLQYRQPQQRGKIPVFLLLHGWTGDEKVMWVFADQLPNQFVFISPRGPYTTSIGGFGWQPEIGGGWPSFDDLLPAVDALQELLTELNQVPELENADFKRLHLMGFSQGAALSYTMGLAFPESILGIIGLAGFLPNDVADVVRKQPLHQKPVFVSHGMRDDIVPVARARQSVEVLERAGADVTYCEADVGHKLGAVCFRAMRSFVEKELV